MKRPPGLWVLLAAGVLWLSVDDVYGIRATALIFGKSTTTTAAGAEEAADPTSAGPQDPEAATEASATEAAPNATRTALSGVPQVDYIFDPNLPKELNGYNLTEYPFYERVPEDIDFKCDGLHDGFYASVPHKCQVYHHCLFGTRYDFLCANYTAFDQKTFICHFVSEVDCVNSKKYWHRNDALYQAATTTTTTTARPATTPAAPPPEGGPRRSGGRLKPRKKRPLYEYYEDYDEEYDYEPPPRKRYRPRPRPRPIYEEYDEDYEEGRYERGRVGHRRPGERRRYQERRKFEYEDYPEVVDNSRRKQDEGRASDRRYQAKRRPADDEVEERRRERPKHRRPLEDDYEEEEPPKRERSSENAKGVMKASSGSSIYDRPRAAPKIKPPVPKNEADKYAYKTVSTTKAPLEAARRDEEYYDEEYAEEPVKPKRRPEVGEGKRHSPPLRREESRDNYRKPPPRKRPILVEKEEEEEGEEEEYEERTRRPPRPKLAAPARERPRAGGKRRPAVEDYYEDYEEESREKAAHKEEAPAPTAAAPTTTTTTTPRMATTTIKEIGREVVRIVKRPFLPSRGGNPYAARGLQPVGSKALDKRPEYEDDLPEPIGEEPKPQPSPIVIKVSMRQTTSSHPSSAEEQGGDGRPAGGRPPPRPHIKPKQEPPSGLRTTQKPEAGKDLLDIEDYDVTLNDALNPTLPNLPVRGYPTGFSANHDYTYVAFQRPRPVVEPALTQAGPEFAYQQTKPVRQEFVNTNQEYKGQYSSNVRPRIVQLQNYYPNY